MNLLTTKQKTYYILRMAAAMCFIGHGAFGIITKPIWSNYFAVFGIGHNMAYHLMPVVGVIDILMGISLIFYPTRAIVVWLVIWGFLTAALRPLSGEAFAELLERGGNFGAPLALLILCGSGEKGIKKWISLLVPSNHINEETLKRITKCLIIVVFLLFVGHGWLNLIGKKGLLGQYSALGFSNPLQVAHIAGIFEIVAACVVLIRPVRSFLLILFIWKISTELFYPHWELFEWIERAGSYGSILALWFTLGSASSTKLTHQQTTFQQPAI